MKTSNLSRKKPSEPLNILHDISSLAIFLPGKDQLIKEHTSPAAIIFLFFKHLIPDGFLSNQNQPMVAFPFSFILRSEYYPSNSFISYAMLPITKRLKGHCQDNGGRPHISQIGRLVPLNRPGRLASDEMGHAIDTADLIHNPTRDVIAQTRIKRLDICRHTSCAGHGAGRAGWLYRPCRGSLRPGSVNAPGVVLSISRSVGYGVKPQDWQKRLSSWFSACTSNRRTASTPLACSARKTASRTRPCPAPWPCRLRAAAKGSSSAVGIGAGMFRFTRHGAAATARAHAAKQ